MQVIVVGGGIFGLAQAWAAAKSFGDKALQQLFGGMPSGQDHFQGNLAT